MRWRRSFAAAHARGLPVVVDAAHAPHFHFCRALPTAAEDAGADFVAQSTHKVASALSQGSVLLVRDESTTRAALRAHQRARVREHVVLVSDSGVDRAGRESACR